MPTVTITSAEALKNFPSSADASSVSTLIVKSITLDPAVLLTCLSKCADSLEELRLEKVKLSADFKKNATLPKLKTFFFHQVTGHLGAKDSLEEFLDSLDTKVMLFFEKKAKTAWDLEQIWDLKVNVTLIVDGWRILDVNQDELSLTSMLPQSDDLVANAPRELTKLALYDAEITSDSHIPTAELTHLTLYEVIMPDMPAVLKQCNQLEELSIYEENDDEDAGDDKGKKGKQEEDEDDEDYEDEGEEEEEDGDVDDWNAIELAELPSKSLKRLALGRARLSAKLKGAVAVDLESLALENCKADQESLKLLKGKSVLMTGCDPQPTATILKRMTDASSTQSVLMNGFNWEAKDTNKKKMNELLKASSASGELYSGEEKFLLEKAGAKWKGRKFEDDECKEEQYKLFNWSQFCLEENWKKMFD